MADHLSDFVVASIVHRHRRVADGGRRELGDHLAKGFAGRRAMCMIVVDPPLLITLDVDRNASCSGVRFACGPPYETWPASIRWR